MRKAVDTSAYEPGIIFSNVPLDERPDLGIHRATFSSYYQDPYLADYFAQWKSLDMKQGCYMVLWSDADPVEQVKWFKAVVDAELNGDYGDLNPVLDVEDKNLTFQQVVDAVFAIKAEFGVYPIIYTAFYVWRDNIVGSNDPSIISQNCDLWMAQYNTTPNLVPIGWSEWAMWQYTESGRLTGISYSLDLNWIADWFWETLTGNPGNPTESWFDGAAVYSNGWMTGISGNYFKYHITKIDKSRVEKLFVTATPLHPRTTGYVAETRGVDILSNGGEAIYTYDPALPKGQSVSEGVPAPLAPLSQRFLSMQFDSAMNFLGFLVDRHTNCYWAVGISDILLENGVVPDVFDTEEADPRSTLFWNDTHWMFIHVDGRNNGTPGCRLREVADLARGLGMKNGGNLDGGDSSTLVYMNNGVPVTKNNPPEGYQHALADHFGFILNEGGTPVPEETWEGTALYKIGVWRTPQLQPKLARTLKKGATRIGKLVEGDGLLWLEFNEKRLAPVRSLTDPTQKWMTLKKVGSPPAPTGGLYRVKNDQETDRWNYEVRGAAPNPAVWVLSETTYEMGRSVQFFCADLLALSKYKKLYADLTVEQKSDIARAFTGVYRSDAAFTNNKGFWCEKFPVPRCNYVKGENLDLELPRFDKIRVCSGAKISGVEDGTDLIVDHFETVPTGYGIEILDDPRVFRATIIKTDGTLINFPQLKDGSPVYVPILSKNELRIPLKYLEKLP